MWEAWVRSLGWEDPLEKERAPHSNTLAWKISWTEEPGGLQSTGSQRVGHDGATPSSSSASHPASEKSGSPAFPKGENHAAAAPRPCLCSGPACSPATACAPPCPAPPDFPPAAPQPSRTARGKLWPFLFYTVWKLLRTFAIVILEKENIGRIFFLTVYSYGTFLVGRGGGLTYSTQDLW